MSFGLDSGELCEVYEVHWQTARKTHRCECCRILITPGAQYRRDHWVHDGTAASEACCFGCAVVLHLWLQWHGSHPSPGWAFEFIRESISETRRDREDKAKYRDERSLLAGIYWRNRAAQREARS